MKVYTSDGLLVSRDADTGGLSTEQGQQLISIYRLFLQLHHAGTGTMRIKDMIKPETTDAVGEHGSGGAGGDKNADRRGGGAGRGGSGAANTNWSSVMPPMPENTAYTSSIAVVSTGTPYPMFLLSSNAIPETHRLRGFASAVAPQQQQHAASAGTAATASRKNNNRSANGCEEIAVRWSLLAKQPPSFPVAAAAGSAPGAATGASAGTPDSITATVNATTAIVMTADTGADVPGDRTGCAGARTFSMSNTKSAGHLPGAPQRDRVAGEWSNAGNVAPASSADASPAHTAALAPCAHPSGWTAAELQVHTTKQVMMCTASELSLDLDGGAEDGNAPLLFCCSTLPISG
ncbi:conserved hypothetical protein [Leishmania mexicana MHOM/GT/2001/U1103]|uniref:Uncharacterized protein n=1 Tax=Leishmania mexicana (strain MHOM/GT/2001/U1103) TaxID=929439 RepID=E9AQ45_LEIMU|nr:conserved hypothetical protein [Leishmania mexicana MHOM/GT/2001/U1103]CBZ25063.1 conserved hypothetical protein [Leishmania mexicana MHOM/GT/2001/U1103]